MTGRAILRLSPIALLVVVAACGGRGTKPVAGRVYLLRGGAVAPVARELPGSSSKDLLKTLASGPTKEEQATGLSSAAQGSRAWLAQVVYTLSQDAPKKAVTVDGHTYSRSDFEDETPIILVENPLPFTHVTSPIHATGTANTFEATFDYELKDVAGKVLAKHFVTATSGTGQRGTFDVTIPFEVAHRTAGTLVVYEESAANGKPIHESEIPLTLEP